MEEKKGIDLSDLNSVAVTEFLKLVKEHPDLPKEWKEAAIEMVKDGLPPSLDTLKGLLGEGGKGNVAEDTEE